MFVTFEGPEGSGKSTQIERLARWLRDAGTGVVVTREPGGTVLGERLRGMLLDEEIALDAITEAYLMTAARAEHVRRVVLPALERGDWVLCDRYLDSTLAYQGAGRGIDIQNLRDIQELATRGLQPNITFLLDVEVDTGLWRRRAGGDQNRIDKEAVSFHQRVAEWYRDEARRDTERWVVIDANQSIDEVERAIIAELSKSIAGPARAR